MLPKALGRQWRGADHTSFFGENQRPDCRELEISTATIFFGLIFKRGSKVALQHDVVLKMSSRA